MSPPASPRLYHELPVGQTLGAVGCFVGLVVGLVAGWNSDEALPVIASLGFVLAYVSGGSYSAISAMKALFEGRIEVDLLMVLAALGAALIGSPAEGAILLFLFSLSNVLQAFALERTRHAVKGLMALRPEVATVRRNGQIQDVALGELMPGDVLVVRPGQIIGADGRVTSGTASVNQATVTGESTPVMKQPGDLVFGGTISVDGGLEVLIESPPDQSLVSRIVQLVEKAQSNKARSQRFLEKAERRYALAVILFTLGLILVPPVLGANWTEAFYRAMTVMVVMSPCALVISIPATVLSAIGGAARQGILFKGGAHLERAATIETVAFDKTGTLTTGRPVVKQVLVGEGEGAESVENVLRLAAAVSEASEHPLAKAIVTEARYRGLSGAEVKDFRSFPGLGTEAVVDGRRITVGNMRLLVREGACGAVVANSAKIDQAVSSGETVVGVAERLGDGQTALLGFVTMADEIRPEAREAIARLREIGIQKIIMISGDDRRVAQAVARSLDIDEFHGELMPEDKVRLVRSLQNTGPAAMVGDGVNDAPSLAAATVGVAMGSGGTDIAMETADIVLMGNRLDRLALALKISRRARRVVLQNLIFAGGVMVVLTMAALGNQLPLTLGVAGHEGSTVLVCLNGLRLLAVRKTH